MKTLQRPALWLGLALAAASVTAHATESKEVVLVHDTTTDGADWRPIYKTLTQDGYRVLLVEAPQGAAAVSSPLTARVEAAAKTSDDDAWARDRSVYEQ